MSVRPITDTLRQIAGGEFIDKSSDMMAELVKAVACARALAQENAQRTLFAEAV